MISVTIDSVSVPVQIGTELVRDSTEQFNFGQIVIPKSSLRTSYPDYASVEVTIGSSTYEVVIQKDTVVRVSPNIYTHTIVLAEPVIKLAQHIPPDRKFDTWDGAKVTYLYHINEVLRLTFYGKTNPYTIATATQELLSEKFSQTIYADEKEYSGSNLLGVLTDMFRAVGAIPTLSLDNVIGHELINDMGTLITLGQEMAEMLVTDISDYAFGVHNKVKNGTYEADLIAGGTYFPAKGYGVTPRSKDTKFSDAEAEYHIDGGIRRIIDARIKNLQSQTLGTITNAGIANWIVSKEEWDNLTIERNHATLYTGKYQNNTMYYIEGDNRIQNVGTRYFNSSYPITGLGEQVIDAVIEAYWYSVNGSTAEYNNQSLRGIEIEWYYQPLRDSEVRQERHSYARVTKDTTILNNQKDSKVELGRLGFANKQLINRMGNYNFQQTYRYYDNKSIGIGIFDLNDYLANGYKVQKIKYVVRHTSTDITYYFVEKQSIINPLTGVNSRVSPFTITKRNILTNPVYEQYILFSRTKGTDNAYINGLNYWKVLTNAINFTTANDTPIYNCQYNSSDATGLGTDYINMTVQKTPMGNSFQFNAQFQSPRIAGYQLVDDTGYLGIRLKPVPYADLNGQVETCRFYFGNGATIDKDLHPVSAWNTSYMSEIPLTTFNLQPNEKLGITRIDHCITDDSNLIIGDYFLQNNSLIKELGVTQGHTIYFYANNPHYSTDDKYVKGSPDGATGTISLNTITYDRFTIANVPTGYSWAWCKSTAPYNLYMAYNNTGTDLNDIIMTALRDNPEKETL